MSARDRSEKLRKRRESYQQRKAAINAARRAKYASDPQAVLGRAKAWVAKHKEDHLRRKRLSHERNKTAAKARMKKWREANKETRRVQRREYAKANRDVINAYFDKYYQDPNKRLRKNVACSMRLRLVKGKGGKSWEKLIGYTVEDLRSHLESLFSEGMTWDNYGSSSGAERWWTIDHKRSVHSFGYPETNTAKFRECWSLANLQPMWSADNFSKQHRETIDMAEVESGKIF